MLTFRVGRGGGLDLGTQLFDARTGAPLDLAGAEVKVVVKRQATPGNPLQGQAPLFTIDGSLDRPEPNGRIVTALGALTPAHTAEPGVYDCSFVVKRENAVSPDIDPFRVEVYDRA